MLVETLRSNFMKATMMVATGLDIFTGSDKQKLVCAS